MKFHVSRTAIMLTIGAALVGVPLFAIARVAPCTIVEVGLNPLERFAKLLIPAAAACGGGAEANTNTTQSQPCAVLLVHGIYDSDAMWTNMKAAMSTRGYAGRVYALGEVLGQKGLVPNNGDINVLRLQVKEAVTKIKDKIEQETGVRPPCVDVIAHSMGGLVTRAYIQSPDYNSDIRKFIMLGTPNWGSPATYNLLSPLLGTLTGDNALDIARTQMWPQSSFIFALNSNSNLHGIPTIVIGGLDSTYDVKFRNGLGLPNIVSPYMVLVAAGDGVVPLTHMKISGVPLYVSTKVAHSNTVAQGYADNLEIQERVVEFLRTGVVTQSGSFYLDSNTQAVGPESFTAKIGTSVGSIAPGGFLQLGVALPLRGVKDVCCFIGQGVADGMQALKSVVVGPDGTTYDETSAYYNGFLYRNSNEPGGTAMKLRYTGPGLWTYRVTLPANATSEENVSLNLFMLSERGIKLYATTTDFTAGQAVPFRVGLIDRVNGVSLPFDGAGFSATVSVYDANNVLVTSFPLTLDPNATGEFIGSWDTTGRQGEHKIKITVTGPYDLSGTFPDTERTIPYGTYITPQGPSAQKVIKKK